MIYCRHILQLTYIRKSPTNAGSSLVHFLNDKWNYVMVNVPAIFWRKPFVISTTLAWCDTYPSLVWCWVVWFIAWGSSIHVIRYCSFLVFSVSLGSDHLMLTNSNQMPECLRDYTDKVYVEYLLTISFKWHIWRLCKWTYRNKHEMRMVQHMNDARQPPFHIKWANVV